MIPVADSPSRAERGRTIRTVEIDARAGWQDPPDADATGRTRLTGNVLASWGGYLVYIASGFVMPRMIDTHVGQAALGIWDFGFSTVVYLTLAQLGVGVSINRYVSKSRAVGDVAGLNQAVSSAMCVQMAAATAAALITAGLVWALPALVGNRFGDHLQDARWVIALLGAGVAIDMAFDVYRGVLTGCHRWGLFNAIDAGLYGSSVVGMLAALLLGGGIRSLAAVYLCSTVLTQVGRGIAAHQVCPELRIARRYATRRKAREMLAFGGKAALQGLSRLLLIQANNIIVATSLGPATLALYSRPGALVRHVETVVNKLAYVLVPTASGLQAAGKERQLRELLVESARYASGLSLPALLLLGILGDQILTLWMGPRYAHGEILSIMAAGFLLPLAQQPAITILRGLNIHGWIAVTSVAAALVGVGLSVVAINWLQWGLVGAALALTIPLSVGNGIFVSVYASRQLGVPLGEYWRRVLLEPIACVTPFALALVVVRVYLGHRPVLALLVGCLAALPTLAPVYWRYLLPPSIRTRVIAALPGAQKPGAPSSPQNRSRRK
jgi:O-antigen/teichoic acid export membrane protein